MLMKGEVPSFSIIVPTSNRPRQIAECLKSLTCLDYRSDCFEVIVVDDGSRDGLNDLVACFEDQFDLTLIRQTKAGPATARNAGALRARGRYLAYTDDDCRPAPEWLTSLAARFASLPDSAIGGRTLNALSLNLYAAASQSLVDYLYGYYNASHLSARFIASNNLAVPADRFRELGGFDTMFKRAAAEDRMFCDQWLHAGYNLIYAPEALVYHAHNLTLKSFWRQHFNYGRGAHSFHRARAFRLGLPRPRIEPAPFYLNLLRHPFTEATGNQALPMAALMGLTQVAHTAGYLYERLIHTVGGTSETRQAP